MLSLARKGPYGCRPGNPPLSRTSRPHIMPALALVLASACWAATLIAQKAIIEDLAVAEITVVRFLIGAGVMFILAIILGHVREFRRIGWRPAIMGLLEPGAASLFLVWGVANTSAISGSVILSTIPILMPLLGWIVLREAVRMTVLIGGAIPFFLYNFGLHHLPVGRLSLFMDLMGPMGALMAWSYLGTPVSLIDMVAIAIVVFGVALPSLSGPARART